MTVFSVLFCAAAFYFVYALSSLAQTLSPGHPSYKPESQVSRMAIKSGNKILRLGFLDNLVEIMHPFFSAYLQVAEKPKLLA